VVQPASNLYSQSIWLEPIGDRVLYLEILKPSFDYGDYTFPTSVWFLSGRWRLDDKLWLVGELPFAVAEREQDPWFGSASGSSDASIGNPYAAVVLRGADMERYGDFGVRLPFPSEANLGSAVGAITELVDRVEAFAPDVLTLAAAYNHLHKTSGEFAVRARLGTVLDVPTEGGDVELFALYSVQAWYEDETAAAGGGLSGRLLLTQGNLDLGERTLHQLALFVNVTLGRWIPGLQMRFPIEDDFSRLVDLVVGLSLGYELR
jgi:hypothetical protein